MKMKEDDGDKMKTNVTYTKLTNGIVYTCQFGRFDLTVYIMTCKNLKKSL